MSIEDFLLLLFAGSSSFGSLIAGIVNNYRIHQIMKKMEIDL